MTEEQMQEIKNALLRYLLNDVSDVFEHLTNTERSIIQTNENFQALLESIGLNP